MKQEKTDLLESRNPKKKMLRYLDQWGVVLVAEMKRFEKFDPRYADAKRNMQFVEGIRIWVDVNL